MDRKQRYIQKLRTRDISAADKKVVAFLVLESDAVDRKYPVKSGINFVGSANDVDIQLNVPGVSGFHAMIETSDDGMEHFIEDLDSTNGTHLGPSNYPLGAWKLYQVVHKKMVSIGPATCTYQYADSIPATGLGEEEEEANLPFTVESKPFGSPIMIKNTKDFLPSDILKEASSPDSIALINNHDGSDKKVSKNINDKSISKKETDPLFSSDSELELPSQFGRRSNTIEQIEKDLDDIDKADDAELSLLKENDKADAGGKSLLEENSPSHEKMQISNDESGEVLVDSKAHTSENVAIIEAVKVEEQKSKEVPKKRKLLGRKTYILESKNQHSPVVQDKKLKKKKLMDVAECPDEAVENAGTNALKSTKNASKTNIGDDSDESSLNLQTSDQIIQEIMKNTIDASKKDQQIDKLETGSNDNESNAVSTSEENVKKESEYDIPAKREKQDHKSLSETKGKSKKNTRKARIQKQMEEDGEKGLIEANSGLLFDSRHSSTDADLSIAIAMSGGRGKRAAASKALEKTKDMYHNLPPLVEEVVIPSHSKKKTPKESSKLEEVAQTSDLLVSYGTEKRTLKKSDKKATAVKTEPDSTSGNVMTEERNLDEFKENLTKHYKIAFTGGHKDDRKPLESMIRKFGGSVVESWSDCTHLVTDKIRRTSKFLCALTTGKYIMNMNWLDTCKKNGSFVDESLYLLHDDVNEKKYKFSLKQVLEKTQKGLRLFENLRFYATESVKPDLETLEEILHASGAALERNRPSDHQSIIILSCEEDFKEIEKLQKLGYNDIQSMEFVLTGLLRQTLDYSR